MEIKEFNYTANFCQENIWHLCQNPELNHFSKKVLIVSNDNRNCPFRFQKSINGDEFVWWNYHVILLASDRDSSFVYDFDSTLPVPFSAKDYFEKSFELNLNWKESDLPCFKVFEPIDYLNSFVSDQTQMKNEEGNWMSSSPIWPVIEREGGLPLPALLDFSFSSKQKIYQLNEMQAIVEAMEDLVNCALVE